MCRELLDEMLNKVLEPEEQSFTTKRKYEEHDTHKMNNLVSKSTRYVSDHTVNYPTMSSSIVWYL